MWVLLVRALLVADCEKSYVCLLSFFWNTNYRISSFLSPPSTGELRHSQTVAWGPPLNIKVFRFFRSVSIYDMTIWHHQNHENWLKIEIFPNLFYFRAYWTLWSCPFLFSISIRFKKTQNLLLLRGGVNATICTLTPLSWISAVLPSAVLIRSWCDAH